MHFYSHHALNAIIRQRKQHSSKPQLEFITNDRPSLGVAEKMSEAPDNLNQLRKYSGSAYSYFEYVPVATEDDFRIDCGVLFLMAFWSGPAILGFKRICESLNTFDLPNGFVFRVLDWDGATPFLERLSQYDLVIGGNAEALWFRKGEIIAATHVGTSSPKQIMEIIGQIDQP